VHTFLDLGFAPPSNAYLQIDDLKVSEKYYPLRVKVCDFCWLVQTEDCVGAEELFNSEYAYFSSTSSSWLEHAALSAGMLIHRLQLDGNSLVIEVASNDGYLLKNFLSVGIPCLGIEPTASTAIEAEKIGIPVVRQFFGQALAKKLAKAGKLADLIVGNNVYAHVPDVNDFTRGLKAALKPEGSISLEFPHLLRLVEQTQFDTVYHEHFSYFSLFTVVRIFRDAGLKVYDVEELPTHGGSLRVYGCHLEFHRTPTPLVSEMLKREELSGLQSLLTYQGFQARANKVKDELLSFLIKQKCEGKTVVAYGAAAKGNTLLNYAGIKQDLLPVVYDASASKQGKFLPGSHIPIQSPAILAEICPDYLLILPWNIASEVKKQNARLGELGTKFVTAVPQLEFI
jgi:SAM-dependent methyltransferase